MTSNTMKKSWWIAMVLAFAMFSTGCAGVISRTKQGQIKVERCVPTGETAASTMGRAYIRCHPTKNQKKKKLGKYTTADIDILFWN